MKKLISLVLIVVTATFLFGSAKTESTVTDQEKQELMTLSETLLQEFLAGDFTNLRLVMSDEMKSLLKDEQLSQLLTTLSLNQSTKTGDTTFSEQDGYRLVTIPLSDMNLNVVFVYDENSVLAGFHIKKA